MLGIIKEGDYLPDHTFLTLKGEEVIKLNLKDLTKEKKIILFAVPGPFTPACSKSHCPSFRYNSKLLKGKGVDAIYCTSVSDPFVLGES